MLKEILKEKDPNQFEVSNLWEDYGVSRNDNRFKNLKVAPAGLVTKETCKEFKNKVEKASENLLGKNNQEIADEVLMESLSMALIGLAGELFTFDSQELAFQINNLEICLPNFTRNVFSYEESQFKLDKTLFKSLEPFQKAATQLYRIQFLIDHFKQRRKGTLVMNVKLIILG